MRNGLAAATVAALWACNSRPLTSTCANVVGYTNQRSTTATARPLDILFVIDNSTSMGEEQALLNAQFDRLIRKLDRDVTGGFPNAHVGVVSTDLSGTREQSETCAAFGNGGELLHGPTVDFAYIEVNRTARGISGNIPNVDTETEDRQGCQGLTGPDGTPVPAAEDQGLDLCDIQQAFRRNAQLGSGGSRVEQPLEAALRALSRNERMNGECAGEEEGDDTFLRQNSVLAVVFLTDEDDCSMKPDAPWAPDEPREFSCFERGVTCAEDVADGGTGGDGGVGQVLTCCRSNEESEFIHPVGRYVEYMSTLTERGHTVVVVAITGPFASEYAGQQEDDPCTAASVSTTERRRERDVAYSCEIAETVDGGVPDAGVPDGGGGFSRRTAEPAIRINELVRRLVRRLGEGAGAVLGDLPENRGEGICSDDFSPALERLAVEISNELNSYCLSDPLVGPDGETIRDASEAKCDVLEVLPGGEEVPLTPCTFDNGPPETCPEANQSPGRVSSKTPCWYVCRGACPAEWQMGYCGDESCTPRPAEVVLQCLTKDPSIRECAE